jgi:hypothetical protein
MRRKCYFLFFVLIIGSVSFYSCTSTLDMLANIQRLKFKLGNISNLKVAGVSLSGKNSLNDFSLADGLKLTQAFANKNLPTSFRLNVLAKNPNDGTGGTTKTTSTLTKLSWRLLIDNNETINGAFNQPVEVPGIGQEITIPIDMNLNLYDFFKNLGYEGVIRLALALGGVHGSTSRVTLKATPSIETVLGPITSNEITIVDTEFR